MDTINVSKHDHEHPDWERCISFNYIMSFLSMTCAVSCVIGNGLTLPTFARQSRRLGRTPTIFLFQAMAVADLLVLIPFVIVGVYPGICAQHAGVTGFCWTFNNIWLPWLVAYFWPISPMGAVATAWLTVCVTYHRYKAVCNPLSVRANTSNIMKRVYMEVAAIWTFSILFNSTRYFEFHVISKLDSNNQSIYVYRHSELFDNYWYQFFFKTGIYFLLINLVPLTILSILTYRLVTELRKTAKNQAILTSRLVRRLKHREHHLTVTLIVVVIVFILCQIPTAISRLWTAITGFPTCDHYLFYWLGISNLLVHINSSVNFYVYTSCSSLFRFHLKMLLTCGRGTCGRRKIATPGPPEARVGFSTEEDHRNNGDRNDIAIISDPELVSVHGSSGDSPCCFANVAQEIEDNIMKDANRDRKIRSRRKAASDRECKRKTCDLKLPSESNRRASSCDRCYHVAADYTKDFGRRSVSFVEEQMTYSETFRTTAFYDTSLWRGSRSSSGCQIKAKINNTVYATRF